MVCVALQRFLLRREGCSPVLATCDQIQRISMEKAYKLLAAQEEISNKQAKELIDRGLVYAGDQKVRIARAEMPEETKFRIEYPADVTILYQDEQIVAVNKPAFIDSYEIEEAIEGAQLCCTGWTGRRAVCCFWRGMRRLRKRRSMPFGGAKSTRSISPG